jgi:Family of unknown function (DUF6522)
MTAVDRKNGDFVIDAALLADAFGLSQDEIKARMRDGDITSHCEVGVDSDAGRWRLTFYHGDRACRFIVDDAGNILTMARFPVRPRAHSPEAESSAQDR